MWWNQMPVKQRVLDAVGISELPFTACGSPFLAERAPGAGTGMGEARRVRIPPRNSAGSWFCLAPSGYLVCDKSRSTCLEEVKILQQLINLLYFMMFAVPPWHPEDPSSLIWRV